MRMGAEVAFAHPHMDPAGDVIGFDVAPVRVHIRRAGQTLQGHVAMAGGDRGHGALGDLDGQIGAAIAGIRGAQGHVPAIHHQLRSQSVQAALGGAIVGRIHHQVRLHMDLVIAGRSHGHISMRYLDVDRRSRRDLPG